MHGFFHLRRWPILLSALLLLSPLAARSECKLGSFEIPVVMSGLRAVAKLRVNGTEVPMIVDSGAFYSMLTDAAAAQLNLRTRRAPDHLRVYGLTGPIEVRMTQVAKLGFQNAEVSNVEFLVGGNEPGAGTMGLLGRNLLSWADTEYDLANGAIRIMTPRGDCSKKGMAYWAGETPVAQVDLRSASRERTPAIKVKVKVNDRSLVAVLDTGALSILSRKAARRAGLLDDETRLIPAGKVRGAGQGEVPSWLVPVESFEIGDERITHSRIRVADFEFDDADMLIGIDFFLSHRIFVANSQGRMYFTYHGGPVFDLSVKPNTPVQASVEEQAPQDAAAYARRGSAFAARRDLARALADFDRACELEPARASHFRQRGRVKLQLGQSAEALIDLDEALRLDPAEHEARFDRARLNLARQQIEVALEDLRLLDATVPPQAHLRREMGQIYLALNRPGLALAQFDAWVASRPNQVDRDEVLNGRCWARALLGSDLDKALDDCNGALDAKPNQAAYLDSRGLVQLRQGRYAKALADYEAALKLNPQQAWSLLGRGLARLRLDQRDAGLADIAAAKALRPGIEAEARRHGLELP